MLTPERLQQLLLNYSEEVKLFFYSYGLAEIVLDKPLDHVAIKGLDRSKYEEFLQIYAPLSERLSIEPVGPRDIAIAELKQPLDGGTLGQVSILEIMEPKPGAIPTTHDLIDHLEILVPNLSPIEQILEHKEIEFKKQKNDNHTAIVVEVNEWGQEVKFTDRSLKDIADTQLKSGAAKLFNQN